MNTPIALCPYSYCQNSKKGRGIFGGEKFVLHD